MTPAPKSGSSTQPPPRISVVIPNYNSPVIHHTLAALRRQSVDLATVEVLVVGLDQPRLVQEDALVTAVDTGRQTSPAQNRNLGLAQARGEIVCFTDADCLPQQDWLHWLTAAYQDPAVTVVGGSVSFDSADYWTLCDHYSWFAHLLPFSPPGRVPLLASLNLSVRRAIVAQVGPFNEDYTCAAGEDSEWSLRLRAHGCALHFEPRAVVHHCPPRSGLAGLWRHGLGYGENSPKIRAQRRAVLPGSEQRLLPRRPGAMLLAAPLFATLATARILVAHRRRPQAWLALPGIWLSKLAWCLGASRALRRSAPEQGAAGVESGAVGP